MKNQQVFVLILGTILLVPCLSFVSADAKVDSPATHVQLAPPQLLSDASKTDQLPPNTELDTTLMLQEILSLQREVEENRGEWNSMRYSAYGETEEAFEWYFDANMELRFLIHMWIDQGAQGTILSFFQEGNLVAVVKETLNDGGEPEGMRFAVAEPEKYFKAMESNSSVTSKEGEKYPLWYDGSISISDQQKAVDKVTQHALTQCSNTLEQMAQEDSEDQMEWLEESPLFFEQQDSLLLYESEEESVYMTVTHAFDVDPALLEMVAEKKWKK